MKKWEYTQINLVLRGGKIPNDNQITTPEKVRLEKLQEEINYTLMFEKQRILKELIDGSI